MAETEQKIKEAISRFILDSINLRDLKEDGSSVKK